MENSEKIVHLNGLVAAQCPIHGISIGRWDDKSTWRIDPLPEATKDQIEAAKAVFNSFDPTQWQPESVKESAEAQLETLKAALLEAKVLTPEQLQPKR